MTTSVNDIAGLLSDLSAVQTELLDLLKDKQTRMASREPEEIAELQEREMLLCQRLADCQERRRILLEEATAEGLPGDSIGSLAKAMPSEDREPLSRQVREASSRMRLLQHQSLANWVLAQRSLLHLAQLLEIIATGGRMQPTYGNASSAISRGSLLNSEA